MVARAKCCYKIFGKMKLLCVVICIVICEVVAQSPCPGNFDYQSDGSGLITLHPSSPASAVSVKANFTIATRLPSNYAGNIVPLDPNQGLQRYNQGAPLQFQVQFPVTSPRPRLTVLIVNDQIVCYGPADIPGPYQYVSTISLQHTLYLRGGSPNSVFYPQNSFQKPVSNINVRPGPTQVFTYTDDGSGNYPNVNQNQQQNGQNFNVFYQQTTTTPRPIHTQPPIIFYPQQQPQTPPPDYNPYTTERPQQPPPDYNPYTTQQPRPQRPDIIYDQNRESEQAARPSIPLSPTRLPSNPSFSGRVECGMVAGGNDIQPLIYNGQSYARGDIPWLVALYRRKDGGLDFVCGGTLISDRHVVSAAHCLRIRKTTIAIRDFVVKLGVYDLEDWGDDQYITRTLEAANIHEAYDSSSLTNDIVVLTLDKSVEFTTNIRPICLWDGRTDLSRIVGASGVVAGWGARETGVGEKGKPLMARIPIVSTNNCLASHSNFHSILTNTNTTFCAGDRNGVGPCSGDSGGGFYILDSGRWRIRGVVSVSLKPPSGESICNLDQYIIFTDAAKYLRWIRNIVQSSQI